MKDVMEKLLGTLHVIKKLMENQSVMENFMQHFMKDPFSPDANDTHESTHVAQHSCS